MVYVTKRGEKKSAATRAKMSAAQQSRRTALSAQSRAYWAQFSPEERRMMMQPAINGRTAASYQNRGCKPGCTCKRHAPWSEARRQRQREALTDRTCPDDCTCYRHKGKVYSSAGSYTTQHIRVTNIRGHADQYACIDCGKRAMHWSYVHDTDRANVDNYQPRCAKCHCRYDNIHEASMWCNECFRWWMPALWPRHIRKYHEGGVW